MEALLNILSYVFWIVIALGVLVFVHELGHFLAAKLFGMRVEQFSIGFPPKIVGKTVGDTEYRIGAVPLGGYVKISGMVDESLDTDNLASEPEPWEFRAKPVWQRIIVICAGVVFNIIFAVGVYMGLNLAYGEEYLPMERVESLYIESGSFADSLGLKTGDSVVSINGEPVERYGDLLSVNTLLADQAVITVDRAGQRVDLRAPEDVLTRLVRSQKDGGSLTGGVYVSPFVQILGVSNDSPAEEAGIESGDILVEVAEQPVRLVRELTGQLQQAGETEIPVRVRRAETGAIEDVLVTPRESDGRIVMGVSVADSDSVLMNRDLYESRPFGIGEALAKGVTDTWESGKLQVVGLRKIISGKESFRENVGGPVMIARETKRAADRGGRSFWQLLAMLSVILAIMNILPIPALDGGHLVFLIYEGITRREPSLKVRMVMQQVGMVLLLGLMVFLVFNDFLRL
ncbi:MAG: RIP metalloprotease RseP [Bacteroidota bacterium]